MSIASSRRSAGFARPAGRRQQEGEAVITAYRYFTVPIEKLTADAERMFFAGIRLANKTFKTTVSGRMPDLDALTVRLVRNSRLASPRRHGCRRLVRRDDRGLAGGDARERPRAEDHGNRFDFRRDDLRDRAGRQVVGGRARKFPAIRIPRLGTAGVELGASMPSPAILS